MARNASGPQATPSNSRTNAASSTIRVPARKLDVDSAISLAVKYCADILFKHTVDCAGQRWVYLGALLHRRPYDSGVCSNYRPVTQSDRMLTYFGVERLRDELPADVWPTGMAPFLRLSEDGSTAKWIADDGLFGLLPHFAVEVAQGRRTYNARSETVAKLPSFREAWAKGWRCIIPAEHIYEPCWETGKAVRWQIRGPGGSPYGIAGIYRPWYDPKTARNVFTFAMLTVNADGHPIFSRMHRPEDEKRMVVILDPSDYGEWLSCPVAEAPKFFKQWMGPLEASPNPLPPRAPQASSVRARKPPPPPEPEPEQGGLF